MLYILLLRLRRPFVALITDALGNELFRVRRPFWWITSSIFAEIDGKEVGVVHRRWHLWKRIYDLYLGNEQFAVVENPGFWNWTFTLKDFDGEVLAQIDRDWRGFGFEGEVQCNQKKCNRGRNAIQSEKKCNRGRSAIEGEVQCNQKKCNRGRSAMQSKEKCNTIRRSAIGRSAIQSEVKCNRGRSAM
ncbi:unnamed protein product [Trifolium pratense]|uniref:Uncharacterized protein n=1 Tax=Trifolium pratense TaxID=57577 RepID=A0ACB0M4G8_TRIPR|nr:unnamed protein product [Trifolium pratense]